jgi:hypothetical protein
MAIKYTAEGLNQLYWDLGTAAGEAQAAREEGRYAASVAREARAQQIQGEQEKADEQRRLMAEERAKDWEIQKMEMNSLKDWEREQMKADFWTQKQLAIQAEKHDKYRQMMEEIDDLEGKKITPQQAQELRQRAVAKHLGFSNLYPRQKQLDPMEEYIMQMMAPEEAPAPAQPTPEPTATAPALPNIQVAVDGTQFAVHRGQAYKVVGYSPTGEPRFEKWTGPAPQTKPAPEAMIDPPVGKSGYMNRRKPAPFMYGPGGY